MNNLYFEILSFFYILKHQELIANFKKEFYQEPTIRSIFDIVKDFINQYKVEPTADQVIELINIHGKQEQIPADKVRTLWANHDNLSQYGEDWLSANIGSWGQWRSFYTGLEKVITYVQTLPPNMQYTDAPDYIQNAKQIFTTGTSFTMNTSKGHNFFDPETHKMDKLNTRPSGYPFIDTCLNGGLFNRSLIVLMGGPKTGKSQWLCNLAAQSVKNGYNTLYITLEMSYQKVAKRIGANLFNISIDEYDRCAKDANYMTQKMKDFYQNSFKQPGTFYIEEFPTSSATATDIEAFALKLEEEFSAQLGKPFKFHNICIDYINIMRDLKNPNSENTYLKIKSICEDVRAMAQRNEWCVISVTQTNRGGIESSDLNMSDVSESAGLIATVDALFGIIRTTMMRAEGCYYLKAVALRDSEHMGDKKKFTFEGKYLRIEEDPSEAIIADGIDIPAVYTSATANAVSKKQQQQQPVQQTYTPPTSAPQLNVTESQITGVNLFNI